MFVCAVFCRDGGTQPSPTTAPPPSNGRSLVPARCTNTGRQPAGLSDAGDKEDGTKQRTEVEAGAASVSTPRLRRGTRLRFVDVVTIAGTRLARPRVAFVLGMELVKPKDGTYVPLNISSRSVYRVWSRRGRRTSIAGTWFPPRTEFFRRLHGRCRQVAGDGGDKENRERDERSARDDAEGLHPDSARRLLKVASRGYDDRLGATDRRGTT